MIFNILKNKIVIASTNKGKILEIKKIMEDTPYSFLSLTDIGYIPDIEENGKTFQENSEIKSKFIFNAVKMPVIADDSGLSVDYLDGGPGLFSARYGGFETDELRYMFLLDKLKSVPYIKRSAYFITVISYIDFYGNEYFFEGRCYGKIAENPKGSNGFGYDPVFLPDGFDRTMAQLSENEKNNLSSRSIAVNKLRSFLKL